MTDIDKENMSGILWFGEVGFCYPPAEGGSGGVVDDTKGVETGDGSSVLDGAPLNVCVPAGDGDDDIRHGGFELMCSCVAEFSQIHGHELGGRKDALLAEIRDLRRRD